MLKDSEIRNLVALYKAGDVEKRTAILSLHTDWLTKIVRSLGYNVDMLGEACIVLAECLDKYEIGAATLSTYAYPFIKARLQCLQDGVKNRNGVIDSVRRAKVELQKMNGEEPTVEEIAEATGLSTKRVEYLYNYYSRTVPLGEYDVADESECAEIYEPLNIPSGVLNSLEKEWLEYYLQGYNKKEIAKIMKGKVNYFECLAMFDIITEKLKKTLCQMY